MIKDEQTLQRMNFLIQAARLYQASFPEYSSHLLFDFMQLSEKKMIRIDKKLKRKINKKRFAFRKEAKALCEFAGKKQDRGQQPNQLKMQVESQLVKK